MEERETTKQKTEVVASVAFRLALVYLPRNLRLSTRPEVASPLTSIHRLGEGYWLKQSVMSPTQVPCITVLFRCCSFLDLSLSKVGELDSGAQSDNGDKGSGRPVLFPGSRVLRHPHEAHHATMVS
ncbi:uncharacterized protein LOC104445037 isoform X3 [Eucalyptus grandis]|uniref:uncharacterized protein LOC104445037 isoform X3 n=1 Tax=Eucalyptus grandis TaxID=71139 RepID=UPI00192ED61C|nr:uncharacterized protein LOC104445037 isoform X3 [Eucalyptus grandis]